VEHQLPIVLDPPHALHGFGVMYGWQELGKGRARLEFPEPYLGASVVQQIELVDNAIRWSLEYDDGGVDLPFWLGIHPWFARDLGRGGSAELEFDAEAMLLRGSDGIPTGEIIKPGRGPFDDAFTKLRGIPRIVWEGALAVTIESDASWWVIYTEDSDGICVEPQSAPPDAANLGITSEDYLEALFIFEEA
jgi:aldose 1-epimerase